MSRYIRLEVTIKTDTVDLVDFARMSLADLLAAGEVVNEEVTTWSAEEDLYHDGVPLLVRTHDRVQGRKFVLSWLPAGEDLKKLLAELEEEES